MDFLGKLTVAADDRSLAVTPSGGIELRRVDPGDPAGIFLAYAAGDGWFRLQASNGRWLFGSAGQSPIAWYQVLYAIGTNDFGTRFTLEFFEPEQGRLRLAWEQEEQVALLLATGENPYCRCAFDVSTGWSFGRTFTARFLAPGLPQIRRSNQAVGADFSCAGRACVNLSGVRLPGLDAARAKFDGADLSAADLTGADFTGATFAGSRLSGAILDGATLVGADLRGAEMTATRLRGADLEEARVRPAGALGLDFTSLEDRRTRLVATDFSDADLTGAMFDPEPAYSEDPARRTVFHRARVPFSAVRLRWRILDLTDALVPDLPLDLSNLDATQAVLSGMRDLHGRIYRQARFDGAVMQDVNLAGSNLTSASFRGAVLEGEEGGRPSAVLAAAVLQNADLSNALLSGVDFSHAYLFGDSASVAGATLRRVVMAFAYLVGLDLSAVREKQLQGGVFTDACLVNAKLDGADLSGLDGASTTLVRAALQGASFESATLFDAVLVDAAVALEAGSLDVTLSLDGRKVTFPVAFEATRIDPARSTNASTRCPNRSNGPCTGDKLVSPNAPTQWPPAAVAEARDLLLRLVRRET